MKHFDLEDALASLCDATRAYGWEGTGEFVADLDDQDLWEYADLIEWLAPLFANERRRRREAVAKT